jgi:DNA-binding transcriptional MerR regulator
MALRTIGQLARDAGVAIDTVRYYERIGLLPGQAGARTRWRRYPDEILVRLRYVGVGRSIGFTLRELRHLLDLTVAGAPCFCETFDAAVNAKFVPSIRWLLASLHSGHACRNSHETAANAAGRVGVRSSRTFARGACGRSAAGGLGQGSKSEASSAFPTRGGDQRPARVEPRGGLIEAPLDRIVGFDARSAIDRNLRS